MDPHQQTLEDAIGTLADAADAGRWEVALEAATTARGAVDWLIAEDPELADCWISSDDQDRLARAATLALGAGRLDIADRLLDAGPDLALGDALAEARAAVRALRAGDPEQALAVLATATPRSVDHKALVHGVAELTATALDAGAWEQRMLGVVAIAFAAGGDDDEDAYAARLARQAAWAATRNLPFDVDLLAYVFTTACTRRREACFDACAASYGYELFAVSRELFDHAVAAARRRLDAGDWACTFSTFALGAVLDGRDAELGDRVSALSTASSGRGELLVRSVDGARERIAQWRSLTPAPRRLEPSLPSLPEPLGGFDLDSGIVTIGDPGYTGTGRKLQISVLGVKAGRWLATVVRTLVPGALRCAYLFAHHLDHPCSLDQPIWIDQGTIDVEYATAGIFDCAHYYDERVIPASADPPRAGEHPWFDLCVTRAHGPPGGHDDRGAGVIPFGCVSASPGDGAYRCFATRGEGQVVGLCIDLTPADEDEPG